LTSLVGENSILDESHDLDGEDDPVVDIRSVSSSPSRSEVSRSAPRSPRIESMKEDKVPKSRRQPRSNRPDPPGAPATVEESLKVGRPNRVILHIYDLIAKDTLVQFPSPLNCVCEIGKCFNDVNSALHELGTGAYQ